MKIELHGSYADGLSSNVLPATMHLKANGEVQVLNIDGDDVLFLGNINKLSISSRLGNTPRAITLAGNQKFITPENDLLDNALRELGVNGSLIHFLESHLIASVFAAVLTLTLISAYFLSGLPYTAKLIAENLPESVVETFGAGTQTLFDKIWFEPSKLDADTQAEIAAEFEVFLQAHAELRPKLIFRSGMGPNALALPDGTIVFTDALVELADNKQELISVLLHEIGHLKKRHLIRRAIQDSMMMVVVVLIVGDLETADILLGLPTLLVDLSYSRDFELEADHFALAELQANEIDVKYFASIMTRLQAFYSNTESDLDDDENTARQTQTEAEPKYSVKSLSNYLSTHPATVDRVKLIEQYQ